MGTVARRLKGGRLEPYTERGISRVSCLRCGKPSVSQWQVCALDNRYYGLCWDCDYLLQVRVLTFLRIPNWRKVMRRYQDRKEEE